MSECLCYGFFRCYCYLVFFFCYCGQLGFFVFQFRIFRSICREGFWGYSRIFGFFFLEFFEGDVVFFGVRDSFVLFVVYNIRLLKLISWFQLFGWVWRFYFFCFLRDIVIYFFILVYIYVFCMSVVYRYVFLFQFYGSFG